MDDEAPVPTAVGFMSHTQGGSTSLFYTGVFMPVFSIPIVLLRLWTSQHVVNKWHKDDTLVVIATFWFASVCLQFEVQRRELMSYAAARLGSGDHIFNVSPKEFSLLLDLSKWAGVPLYALSTLVIKAAILLFYLRFSVDRSFEFCTYTVLFVVVVYCLAQCIGHMTIDCYKPTDSGCQPLAVLFIVCAACNVATDLAILFLPIWILRPMKVPTGRKVGIALILMAGGFVSAVSIVRLISTIYVKTEDLTYEWGNSIKWR
ncbi:hypothetical protein B0J15DRAFT_512623 [Fusarium solani]|uniref:Rhodopsin domain-containing protein n=1 Tax=Fusarium solani TaxID=169388 RepID=A0A9P9HJF6_FUSSL|nr:uncharacterized protein B0J15DRAFT_512623 [Fusarium solani]KAH7258768.1 hypothetical protein B0J15DRAFT_512623 [Fusarium solani]